MRGCFNRCVRCWQDPGHQLWEGSEWDEEEDEG